jgi:hypothetical protein
LLATADEVVNKPFSVEAQNACLWPKAAAAAMHPTRKLSRDKLPSMKCR